MKALKGVTLDVRDQSVSSLLLNLANQFPLSYTVEGNTLTLAKKETTQRKGGVRGQVLIITVIQSSVLSSVWMV